MPKWIAFGLGTLTAALAIAVVMQASTVGDLKHKVSQLEDTVSRIESRQKNREAAAPSRMEIKEIQEDIARVQREARDRAAELSAKGAAPEGPALAAISEEAIEQIVNEQIQQRIEEGSIPQNEGGNDPGGDDRKIPLSEISKDLQLDPAVEDQVAEAANETKRDIFELLRTPRPDGSSMADDIVEAFTGGEPERAREIFNRLFTEAIPGTDTTYVAAIGNIQEQGRVKLRGFMGAETYTRFARMNVHPENIQTGWDPWADYVQGK